MWTWWMYLASALDVADILYTINDDACVGEFVAADNDNDPRGLTIVRS